MSEPHSEIKFYPAEGFVLIRRFGDMSVESMLDGAQRILIDPRFDAIGNILSDLTEANLMLDNSDMSQYAKFCKERLEGADKRIAIVAPDARNFGMARMFEMLSGLEFVTVFYTQEEALNWLGLGSIPDKSTTDNSL